MANNRRLSATLVIGGALASSLTSATSRARGELDRLGQAARDLERRQRTLGRAIQEIGRNGNGSVDGLRARYGALTSQIERARIEHDRLMARIRIGDQLTAARGSFRGQIFERVGTAVAAGAVFRSPLKAFTELDDAMTSARIAFMDRSGGLPAVFETIKKQTIDLGNLLPGTTADFVNLARAMKEQGMSPGMIAGTALESAAHLAVIMRMVPESAGEMVAKLSHSFQLAESDFKSMADYSQRAKFGFGLTPDDLLLGAKYYGGRLNALGLTGIANLRRVYAIQGYAAQRGIDGSTFGTNFSMMLTRMALMSEKLNKNSKIMRHVNSELSHAGIRLDFFDRKGEFAGVENMIDQLQKLKVFNQEKRFGILKHLFEEEGGRIADLIVTMGPEGYKKALERMDNEASIDQRIKERLESFSAKVEALFGTITNLMAAIGEPIANELKPIIDELNAIIGGPVMDWVKGHPEIVKVAGLVIGAAAGLAIIGAGLAALGFAATMVGGAIAALGTPIGIVTAVAAGLGVAALAIKAKWGTLKAFWDELMVRLPLAVDKAKDDIKGIFTSLWDWLKSSADDAWNWIIIKFDSIGKAIKNLWPFWGNSSLNVTPNSAPAPEIAAPRGGGATVHDNREYKIEVTVPAGSSPSDVAEAIAARLKGRGGDQRPGGALYDMPTGD